jgi:S-formylglutathione hydrolase FrmB
MKTVAVVALVAVVSASAMTLVSAQGRAGGGRAGGGRGGPGALGAGPRTGTIDRIVVHGRSLEKNLEGDSADREVLVYLPPSYAAEPARRFPTVYLLHGYGGREDTFTERLGNLAASANRLDGAQGFSSAIYVMPNAYTLHKGSMYSSSVTTGDWERFIAEDLVAHIDGRYRTLPARMSRGLAGHSMGGYGAIRIGMKRPDVFASLYLMSACCLTPDSNPPPATTAAAEGIKTREQAEKAASAPGFGPSLHLALAAAWSPNPSSPPLFLDLPVKDGKVRPDIVAKWTANAPSEMLGKYVENLNRYYAIAMDIGLKDTLLASNRELNAAMTRLRIPHTYEEYDGDHTNKVGERLERNVLPFFARNLVAPSNPTSPSPEADSLTTAR